jgi:hypothetical protein
MVGYLRKASQNPKEIANHKASMVTLARSACHRNRIIRRHVTQAYARKATAAAAMERASVLAYDFPSVTTVSARVASPTEGAAPNSPAKLLGFKTSARAAKKETINPPTRKRKTSCTIRLSRWNVRFLRISDEMSRVKV